MSNPYVVAGIAVADWGPLVIATDVDDAVIAKLKEWLPTYLTQGALERELGYELPAPNSYSNVLTEDEFMDNQLPAMLVTTADTAKVKGGANSKYEATWRCVVTCVVRGRNARETRFNAAIFEGAVRRAMLQKARGTSATGSPLNDVDWKGTKLSPVHDTSGKGRYLAAGVGTYNVSTDYAAQGFGGPDIPNANAYGDLAEVVSVTTEVEPKS